VPVLGGGDPKFRDDDGSADPRAAAALVAFASGEGSEHAALTTLACSRLLVPIVASPVGEAGGRAEAGGRSGAGGRAGDKNSEMALPALVGRDGRRAVPAFTCLDSLARWRPEARPVPAPAALVWRAAVDDSCAVVVDIAGPVPLAIDGARLAALADGLPVPLPHEDPDVLSAVRAAAADEALITGLRVTPGNDVEIELTLAAGCAPAAAGEAARRLGTAVMARLGGRLRRGIAVAVVGGLGQSGPPGRQVPR
jgi:SseB protein N-terminal domain